MAQVARRGSENDATRDSKGRSGIARDHLLPSAENLRSIVQGLPKKGREENDASSRGWIFTMNGKLALRPETVTIAVTECAKWLEEEHGINTVTARDIRLTCETCLPELGVSKDIRAPLLSHEISGVLEPHVQSTVARLQVARSEQVLLSIDRFLAQADEDIEDPVADPSCA